MASDSEVELLRTDAKAAVLRLLVRSADSGQVGTDAMKAMAEAYAWLEDPRQPH